MKSFKHYKYALMACVVILCIDPLTSLAQSADQNYILTRTFKSAAVADGGDTINKITTIQYYDGLSRPSQTVRLRASPTGKDIIDINTYDPYNREAKLYLPYVDIWGGASLNFRTGALTDQLNFYSSSTIVDGVVRTSLPFGVSGFESAPINRKTEIGFAGSDWQMPENIPGDPNSSRHTKKRDFMVNNLTTLNTTPGSSNKGSQKVARYDVAINTDFSRTLLRTTGKEFYQAGDLSVTISKDENWRPSDGCLGVTEEYTDKTNRILLRRTYNKVTVAGTDNVEMLSTYYVYDNLGNLCFVLPPSLNPDAAAGIPSNLNDFAYQYSYDVKNRLIKKKIPGRGWEFLVYNKLDQLVATQNALQRAKSPQEVSFLKYDNFDRVAVTGTYNLSASYASGADASIDIQASADAVSSQYESRIYSGTSGTTDYTSASFPGAIATTPLVVNYYDDYAKIPDRPVLYTPATYSSMTRGLQTAKRYAILSIPSQMLMDVVYYDDFGRVATEYSRHYKGGAFTINNYDVITNNYDFTGNLVNKKREHYITQSGAAVLALTINNAYTFDHVSRLKQSKQRTGATNAPEVLLSNLFYNEIGLLKEKQLQTGVIQKMVYKYNERGWLTQVNDPASPTANQAFGYQLTYNSADPLSQFNGNVFKQTWQTKGPTGSSYVQKQQTYTYSYDKINRLLLADYAASGDNTKFNEEVTYDQTGNIQKLRRKDNVTGYLNDFTYNYTAGGVGNKLWNISDGGTAAQNSTYNYDVNGNNIADSKSGITNVVYNLYDLPQTITRSAGNIVYTYDANGTKIRKVVGTVQKDYIDGIEYTNNTLDFVSTPEGRAVQGTGGVFEYEYYLTDHLANIRASIKQDGTILQIQNYYPFGQEIKSISNSYNQTVPANQYKFNNKELQTETGYYDFGARFYDPVIARWTSIDPLAEKSRRWSPFNYAFDNPIRFIDPDGMDAIDADEDRPVSDAGQSNQQQQARHRRRQAVIAEEEISGKLSVTLTTTITSTVETANGSITTKKTITATDVVSNSETEATVKGDVTIKTEIISEKDGKTTVNSSNSVTESRSSTKQDLTQLNAADKSLEAFRNDYHAQFNSEVTKRGKKQLDWALYGGSIPFAVPGAANAIKEGAKGLAQGLYSLWEKISPFVTKAGGATTVSKGGVIAGDAYEQKRPKMLYVSEQGSYGNFEHNFMPAKYRK